jgi:hypothetical protein
MNPTQIKSARLRAFDSAAAVFSGEVIELAPNKAKLSRLNSGVGKSNTN